MTAPSEAIDLHATYVRRGDLLLSLPGRAKRALLRVLRRERRRYLVVEMPDRTRRIIGRFSTEEDCNLFMAWVGQSHGVTFRSAFEFYMEALGEANGKQPADAGEPRTA